MDRFGLCGLECGICDYMKDGKCKGCHVMKGNSLFGECKWYRCCTEKGYEHCGKCNEFPCNELHTALKEVNGLAAIDNLKIYGN
ncbi:DUF3795 domain-containing protein [Fusibacter paucivorans]|uniref:DUF3795 domain-containing protein n=1 Tax=Fusibacter paucivorans TaxID=76009 RepID=A0ABS5PUG7_9FIRM|nr:DUF3795 domain-containing protein [Fusibacter paucivorans]MBS7528808.1 DUF3795 domain-containing protein [Fusibacter paucivorans]